MSAPRLTLAEPVEVEHGVEAAYYSNSPFGYRPVLECLCGFRTSNACSTWAEVGDELDQHLAESKS
jgi:hypothetical protein